MARVYELKRLSGGNYSIELAGGDITRTASTQYPGTFFTATFDGSRLYCNGPREALLELKYDLEKKCYER